MELSGVEHLGRGDNNLASLVTLLDHHLLGEDNFFNRDFNTQVTTGNHDTVRRFQNFVEK
jgi:hypothetical protein